MVGSVVAVMRVTRRDDDTGRRAARRARRRAPARCCSTAFWLSEPLSVISRGVDRRRLVEQHRARDARRAAGALARRGRRAGSAGTRARTRGCVEHVRGRRRRRQPGAQARHSAQVREDERRDVRRDRGPRSRRPARSSPPLREDARAQRADADPRAGRELEVLGEPPVEHEPLARDRRDRRTAARRPAGRSPPRRRPRASARRRPSSPGVTFGPRTRASSFSPTGASFSSTPGRGQADAARRRRRRGPVQSANGAVSVAPRPVIQSSSSPQASTATSLQLVAEPLAEAGGGVEEQLQLAEEALAQHRVARAGAAAASRRSAAR